MPQRPIRRLLKLLMKRDSAIARTPASPTPEHDTSSLRSWANRGDPARTFIAFGVILLLALKLSVSSESITADAARARACTSSRELKLTLISRRLRRYFDA